MMQNVQINQLAVSFILVFGFTDLSSAVSSKAVNTSAMVVRNQKIMHGFPTYEGEFGWQASLELLHPSLGFIGHWCGGVLIHKSWVISAGHCMEVTIQNDLFNLPLPALWTVVLGENDRNIETGYEQRIPVEKIFMHEKYRHFKNDLVLLKLTRAANLMPESRVSTIFLPSSSHTRINPSYNVVPFVTNSQLIPDTSSSLENINDLYERNENFLRKLEMPETSRNFILDKIKHIDLSELSRRNKEGKLRFEDNSSKPVRNITTRQPSILTKKHHRRNDKFLHRRPTNPEDYEIFMSLRDRERPVGIDYYDCMTAGWGKFSSSGYLSDVLLKINVPIHNIKRCEDVYAGFVSLHPIQHLCAGRLDGSGGSCIGDSGGGLQCKLNKNGPWILVGITSFGSGCAKKEFADVFTNVAYFKNWIDDVIRKN